MFWRTCPSIEPCLPRPAKEPPLGPGWIHEIKHDGFRIMARRDGSRVRLISRNGHDLSRQPIKDRKLLLKELLRKAHPGIAYNRHFDVEGVVVFYHACKLGCEGIVSKRLGSPYTSGRVNDWLKIKNPSAPAVRREAGEDWSGKRKTR